MNTAALIEAAGGDRAVALRFKVAVTTVWRWRAVADPDDLPPRPRRCVRLLAAEAARAHGDVVQVVHDPNDGSGRISVIHYRPGEGGAAEEVSRARLGPLAAAQVGLDLASKAIAILARDRLVAP